MANDIVIAAQSMVEQHRVTPLGFTEDQKRIVLDSLLNGASPQEAEMLWEVAKGMGLDPLKRQIHFVKRSQKQPGGSYKDVWSFQVSIDGFRSVAESTGLYDGQDEPEFEYNDRNEVILARVKVYRKDWSRPSVGVARYSEYVQTYYDKESKTDREVSMWAKMPHAMLAKCAEALAIRKAFPNKLGGAYTPEEMGQANNEDRPEHRLGSGERRAPELPAAIEEPKRPTPEEAIASAINKARVVYQGEGEGAAKKALWAMLNVIRGIDAKAVYKVEWAKLKIEAEHAGDERVPHEPREREPGSEG